MTEHNHELDEQGQARRRFLKQAGTVAWASPFIVTMMSRAAHAGHGAQCGVQDIGELGGCDLTGFPVCGSAHACVPDITDPGAGNPCICVSA